MSTPAFVEMFLSLSLQASVVVLGAAALVKIRNADRNCDRLWAGCHVSLLVLVCLAVGMPHLRLAPHSIVTNHVDLPRFQQAETVIGATLAAIWLCGVAIGLSKLIIGSVRSIRILRSATPLEWRQVPGMGSTSCRSKTVLIRLSRIATGPFCWQVHRPIILLPAFVRSLPDEEFQAIVRHELQHLWAGHPLHLFLQRLVEILFWFHPLVWYASYEANRCREFHCDVNSVSNREEAAVYLRILLRLVERRGGTSVGTPAALAFGAKESLLSQRASRLVNRDWLAPLEMKRSKWSALSLPAITLFAAMLWIPIDATASHRSLWSPWPQWSAHALHAIGAPVRDYEIDGHRLRPHEH